MKKKVFLIFIIFCLIQCQEKKNVKLKKLVKTNYQKELIRSIDDSLKICVNNSGYLILVNSGVKMDSLLVEKNNSFDFNEFKMLHSFSNIYKLQNDEQLNKLDYIQNKNSNFIMFACTDLSFNVPC